MFKFIRNLLFACYAFLWVSGCSLFAWDPGTGPGDIDATDKVAYVSQTYYFADGNSARGAVYFKNGFVVPANASVTLDIFPPVVGTSIDVHPTATVLLERPLWIRTEGWFMKGTFSSGLAYGAPQLIVDPGSWWVDTTRLAGNTYFPKGGMLDFKGSRFTTEPYSKCIYVGTASSGGGVLKIKNVRATLADSVTSQSPVYQLKGAPAIQSLTKDTSFWSPVMLYFENALIEVVDQLTLEDMEIDFQGNCYIKNANPIDPTADVPGARRAKFRINTTVPMNTFIMLFGPSNCVVGPDVEMSIGDLGQPTWEGGDLIPYGSIAANGFSEGLPMDNSLTLLDASLSFSRPSSFEGGTRLVVQGSCNLSSTATDTRNSVLTFGRSFVSGRGALPLDAVLDIQPASVLNVHNMVLNNNNNP